MHTFRGRRRPNNAGELLEGLAGRHAQHRIRGSTQRADGVGDLGPCERSHRLDLRLRRWVIGDELTRQGACSKGQRNGHFRFLVRSGSQFQRSAADIHHQQLTRRPSEPPTNREERQPSLLFPGQDVDYNPRASANLVNDRLTVARTSNSRRRKGDDLRRTLILSDGLAVVDKRNQGVDQLLIDDPIRVRVFGQPKRRLVLGRGDRRSPVVRIHQQQVHRVASHVEDAHPHTATLCPGHTPAPSRTSPSSPRLPACLR